MGQQCSHTELFTFGSVMLMLSVELCAQGVKSKEGLGDLEKLSVLFAMLHFNRLQLEDLKN
jgi:hypothetical protein